MSELITNLQHIYNIKLELKDVLETDSDLFEEYPDIVAEKIAQGGGSGSASDGWYDGTGVENMIFEEESSADYVYTEIGENFTVAMGEDENQNEIVEAVEWDYEVEVEENNEYVSKMVHVIVSGDERGMLGSAVDMESDFEEYSDLYNAVYPILQNATLTASEDPSNDGYDYLLEGDLYAWNLNDCFGQVQEITENGFYGNGAALGYNVNVEAKANTGEAEFTTNGKYYAENDGLDGWHYVKVDVPPSSGITPSGTINISSNGTTDVTPYAYAYVNVPTSLSGSYSKILVSGLWNGWDMIDLQNITPRYLSLATLHDITYDGGTPEYYCLKLEYTDGNTVATENHPGYNQTFNYAEGDVCVINNLFNGNYTFKVYLQHYIFDNVDDFTLDSDTVLNPATPYIDISITGNISDKNLELWNSGGSNLVWNVYYKGSAVVFHA